MLQKYYFLMTAHSERQSVVVPLHLIIQQRALACRYGLPSSLFDQESQGSCFVKSSQLTFVLRRPTVAENTMSLYEDLVDIHDKSTSISESVPIFDPFHNRLTVLHVLRGGTQVARAENICLLLDGKVVMRDDPVIIHSSHLLHFVLTAIEVNSSGPWSEYAYNSIHLLPQLGSNQVVRMCLPNGEDAANREIGVHN